VRDYHPLWIIRWILGREETVNPAVVFLRFHARQSGEEGRREYAVIVFINSTVSPTPSLILTDDIMPATKKYVIYIVNSALRFKH
jgi:hypothetical protein